MSTTPPLVRPSGGSKSSLLSNGGRGITRDDSITSINEGPRNSELSSGTGGTRKRKATSKEISNKVDLIRRKTWKILAVSEAVLGAIVIVQIWLLFHNLATSSTLKVQSEMSFLNTVAYPLKIDQLRFGMKGQSQNAALRNAVPDVASAETLASARKVLMKEISNRKIEFAMLATAQGDVIASGNHESARNDLNFDPQRLISNFALTGLAQEVRAMLLTSAEFSAMSAPEHREAGFEELPTWNTEARTLVRFVLTRVSGFSRDDKDAFLVVGDAVTAAKPSFIAQTVQNLEQGIAVVATRNPEGGWKSSMAAEFIDGTVQSFGAEFPALDDALLDEVVLTPGSVVLRAGQAARDSRTLFTVACVTVPGLADSVLIRGFPEDTMRSIWAEALAWNICLLVLVFMIDALGLWWGMHKFLNPLEEVIAHSRKHEYEQLDTIVAKMKKSRVLVVRLIVTGIFALGCLGLTLYINLNLFNRQLDNLVSTRNQASTMSSTTYMIKVDQMRLGFTGKSNDLNIRSFVGGNDANSSSEEIVSDLLRSETRSRRIEVAALIDADSYEVIANAGPSATIGKQFNHMRIVEKCVSGRQAITISTLFTFDLLRDFMDDRMIWSDDLADHARMQQSTLHPVLRQDVPTLVRLVAIPVWHINSDPASDAPRGVLIAGDIVNGKSRINAVVTKAYFGGFAATYVYNENTFKMDLISGIYQKDELHDYETDRSLTDNKASNDVLFGALMAVFRGSGAYHGEEETTIEGLADHYFSVAAAPIPPNPTGFSNVMAFNVRASSSKVWVQLRNTQLTLQIFVIVFQLVSCAVVTFMMYNPLKRFLESVELTFNMA